MTRFGMTVDVNRCVGCQTCTIACKHANDTPPDVQWRRVLDVERGTFPDVERLFLVVGCQHCAEPPCVPVCPTGATRQRDDGLVTMDYDICIGCGYCAVACPYQARDIGFDKSWYYGDQPTLQEKQVYHREYERVANKCTFCVERIDEAKVLGRTPGVDLEYTPACVSSCISQALKFGDYADPDSVVSRLARDNKFFQMHEELGTDPQIKYLYEVPGSMPGRDPAPEDVGDLAMSDPANPLVGKRQTFWDFRAAMNFTMGGMSTGLAIVAWAFYLGGALSSEALAWVYFAAGIGMAVGLFFVFLEIGRKLRFMQVLRRPHSSWMTRETYVVALFYPVLLADLIWPGAVLHAVLALSAAGFLYCQARILYAGKGIPAWRAPLIPWMLIATGLYEGIGLYAFAYVMSGGAVPYSPYIALAGLVAGLVNFGLWRAYRRSAAARGIGPLARRDIDDVTPWLYGFGHLLPLALFAASFLFGPVAFATLGVAGVLAVAGGVMWKFTVITRACHQQGYAVPRMPQRGSGNRAAPPRFEYAGAGPAQP
jgi:Fe-S-cluster-containing dehydrogenase component